MGIWDYVIIAILGVAIGLAIGTCVRNRKQGKTCDGNCAGCSRNCK